MEYFKKQFKYSKNFGRCIKYKFSYKHFNKQASKMNWSFCIFVIFEEWFFLIFWSNIFHISRLKITKNQCLTNFKNVKFGLSSSWKNSYFFWIYLNIWKLCKMHFLKFGVNLNILNDYVLSKFAHITLRNLWIEMFYLYKNNIFVYKWFFCSFIIKI